ncbi:MAG: TerB N-terminal domain-containing protein [Rubrivivax sp.]|nr:TerB N-terminal domain-containing protein [Rubrivivax sp.]
MAGFVLPGMIWVGARHAAGTALHDPSMIDPELLVDRSSSVCTLIYESGLDYATLAPRDRGAYLNWLMHGRRSPVPAGLALLFFKGLERRTFDTHAESGAREELGQLATEMRALAALYGPLSRTLQEHASDLSTLVECGLTKARAYAVACRSPQPTFSPSFELRLAVAQAAFDHAPLPAHWALEWVLQDAHSTVRTSALLCAPELQRLFRLRYQERYGAGIELPSNSGPLVLKYSPASQAIPRGKTLTVVTESTANILDSSPARGELRKLVESCLEELSTFSRFAERSPDRARTIEGLVRIPTVAWPADATEWFESLEAEVRKAPQILALDVFRRRFGGQATMSKVSLAALFKVLGSFGVGVKPLELATKGVTSTAERVVLFSDSGASDESLDAEDSLTLVDDAPPNGPASAHDSPVASGASTVGESQKHLVNPNDTDIAQPDERARAESNEGLATLPPASDDVAARTYLIPAPPVAFNERWVELGQSVEVAQYSIPGMVYVGDSARSQREFLDHSLIDPGLPVATPQHTRPLTYYEGLPAYRYLEPCERGSYLEWLSKGRRTEVPVRLVLMFFAGLERRLNEALIQGQCEVEVRQLAAEMRALSSSYGSLSNLLRARADRLAAILECKLSETRLYTNPVPPVRRCDPLPPEIQVAIGQLAYDRAGLPSGWALAWIERDDSFYRAAPISRHAELFSRLFDVRFAEKYPNGLRLPFNGPQLALEYRYVTMAMGPWRRENFLIDTALEVPADCAERNDLKRLVQDCSEELSKFSRHLGSEPFKTSALEVMARLPQVVWPTDGMQRLRLLAEAVTSEPVVMTFAELAARLGEAPTLSNEALGLLGALMGKLGVRLEPFELLTDGRAAGGSSVALFLESEDDRAAEISTPYLQVKGIIDLALYLATSAGEISSADKAAIAERVSLWPGLEAMHVTRILARMQVVDTRGIDMSAVAVKGMVSGFNELKYPHQCAASAFLRRLASRGEVQASVPPKTMSRIGKALGLRFKLPAPKAGPSLETASSGAPNSGVRTERLKLNQERIAVVQKETARAAELLRTVFESEDAPTLQARASAHTARKEVCAAGEFGLDAAHQALLGQLVTRQAWRREEIQPIVDGLDLMLDGALETINEAVFNAFDVALIEGDDLVEINEDVKSLIRIAK